MQTVNAVNYRSATTSPYSVHYKAPLLGSDRSLIAHRQHVAKWTRAELEDRYLRQLDEHHALKKDNIANHDKIRKLVTRIMRLTGQSFAAQAQKRRTSPDTDDTDDTDCLHLRLIDLESHNAQLRERLRSIGEQQRLAGNSCKGSNGSQPGTHRSRCTSASSAVRCVSSSSSASAGSGGRMSWTLQSRRSVFKSQELMHVVASSSLNETSAAIPFGSVNNAVEPADLTVNETELMEMKTIIERLQQQLGNRTIDDKKSDCKCEDLQATRKELKNMERNAQGRVIEVERIMAENADKWQRESNEFRLKIADLTDRLENEISLNKELTMGIETTDQQLRAAQETIVDSQELQAENVSLKRHRENIAQLANELARRTAAMQKLRDQNSTLRTELDECRLNVHQLDAGHEERMARMHSLQDGHDELVVQLEGLRTQCACLEALNRQLELENQTLRNVKTNFKYE